ncbi:MAG: hypothetical protein P1U57_15000, partial [Oleibacter sp.]|nr:hypothetical protein [Thalassolituus sp.]
MDEFDDMAETEDSDLHDADDIDDDENDDIGLSDSGEKAPKRKAQNADDVEISAAEKEKLRQAMMADVEAFLSRGGRIQTIEDDVLGDPPRRPQTSYGSRPI